MRARPTPGGTPICGNDRSDRLVGSPVDLKIMTHHLPRTFLRTEEEDIREKTEDTQGLSDEDRWRVMDGLCELASESIAQHADPARTLDLQEAVPEDSRRLLARLRDKYAGAKRV